MGAFWEGRYFATAVSTDRHMFQCHVYIDLNMVRAGVISHPSQWKVSGYNDIQNPPMRNQVIDYGALCELGGFSDKKAFRCHHRTWVDHALNDGAPSREPKWTESVAVGPESFTSKFLRKR